MAVLELEVGRLKHGSFNSKSLRRRVLLRVPLPYKVGESAYPGNANEKLRTEAATFVWIKENCPDVPILYLWGFGFPGGQSFMRPENAPFGTRIIWHLRRAILSQDLRVNLFRDLSRIIFSLSQLPLPRIGSWTINERGVLTLANRLLIYQFQSLENEGIPTNIARTFTYTTANAYYINLLACYDNRIRNQPNFIVDEKDSRAQMANLFAMRGLLPHFTSRDLRYGLFVFNLTDLHGSNIFITSRAVDKLESDELQTFEKAYQDFTDIFEEEEKIFSPTYGSVICRTDIMKRGWKIGNFWYFHALKSPKGLFNLFRQHV
ncbi:hypothetical protein DL98DRAFT_548036 [Cadophora sp. DSE1049]|nr:hypothetical protein DL98DRAFT_548036 [Cadophora sp. DSE1049]